MSKIAYIRVSSEKQNMARQRKALKEAGCELFYEEKIMLRKKQLGYAIYVSNLHHFLIRIQNLISKYIISNGYLKEEMIRLKIL